MLDKKSLALLKTIISQTDGGYKVFSIEELCLNMPKQLNLDANEFNDCVNLLKEKEFISVKYQDDNEICLLVLNKGRSLFENLSEEKKEKIKNSHKYYLSAFLGGFTGSISALLFFSVVLLLLRRVFNAF